MSTPVAAKFATGVFVSNLMLYPREPEGSDCARQAMELAWRPSTIALRLRPYDAKDGDTLSADDKPRLRPDFS
jgi:hypothetical protein